MIFATLAAAAMLASCSENTDLVNNVPESGDGPQVHITLTSDPATRAFFDASAAAETWEKEIEALKVYVFNEDGNLIVSRAVTAPEIEAKSVRFTLPNSAASTTCHFYVVANTDYGTVSTMAAMDNLVESVTLGDYNGTFQEAGQGRKRTDGFVMTGKASDIISPAGSSTTIGVTLKRIVAKVAVRTSIDPALTASLNGGTVAITSTAISRVSARSNSFYKIQMQPRTPAFDFAQAPYAEGAYLNNIFYVYENAPLSHATRLLLTLTGYFDADGSSSTTFDRSEVEYQIVMDGAGEGEIKRNGYYRVEATVKGLSGDEVLVTFTVADWETPVTQTVDLD